jgi:adenine-specific DNA glycosylase
MGEIYGKDIFDEVLGISRRRMKKCELCIFSINCASYEFALNDKIPVKLPKNKAIFIEWKPDSF